MFATFKQIFSPKHKDLRKRILFTLMCLLIFVVGKAIVVPGLSKIQLTGDLGFFEFFNVMNGGSLENFSIFALGVMPYISASIIVQFLQMDIIPYFSDLAKEGYTGRQKLNKITRIMGIALAFAQGYLYSFMYLGSSATPTDYLLYSLVLTAGTAFLLWMSDQMTSKGVGNGMSLLIMAGIVSSLPTTFSGAFKNFITSGTFGNVWGIVLFIVFVLLYFLIIIGIIFVDNAERRVTIQYSNKSGSVFTKDNYIPFKLNSSGVMPVILASALISIPGMIAGAINKESFTNFYENWISYNSVTGFILYMALIIAFGYFYTFYVQLKPKDVAESLQKNGGYIPGVRPGENTTKYITDVLKRITSVGTISLAVLAAIPILFSAVTKISDQNVSLGGTGLLIAVGVALETYKQVESEIISKNYQKGRRR
jgi:preprotein translocase subunit SecY